MAARELAVQPHAGTMPLQELRARLHLAPRTLRNHFHETVGESPADFLKAVRLNACRRALRSALAGATGGEKAPRARARPRRDRTLGRR